LITNFGKNVLAKYLVGQAPAYASFIAIGVGPRPLATGEPFLDFSEQEQLEFEVLRMPITSRGFVYDENGDPNVVFLSEIPTDQRYAITEVGIYPGRSNPSAPTTDSRMIYSFSESENWELHTENAATALATVVKPLNDEEVGGVISDTFGIAFRANSNNTIFSSPIRLSLFERPRFLDRVILVRGDLSFLEINNGNLSIKQEEGEYFGSHIHYNGISINLDQNSAEDELRLAFSVLSKEDVQLEAVSEVRLLLEFANADIEQPSSFAKLEVVLNQSDPGVNFTTNRYFVIKKKLGDLVKSPNFTWRTVNSVRIYATILEPGGSTPSDNFYIGLDGLRFENTTTKNPLYGLSGYSVLKTPDGKPIVKESNTSNSIEFRYGLDVE
jgi:hypothetical protein